MNGDFRPTATWQNLRFRANLLRRLREFFDQLGFLEVQTPILSADTVVDRHIDPFCIEGLGIRDWGLEEKSGHSCCESAFPKSARDQLTNPHSPLPNPQSPIPNPLPRRMWLQTSPEFAMKRLLAAGAGPIYEVARVFRVDELGPLHNPEFTLVEWYRPGDTLEQGMQLTSDLCEALLSKKSGQAPCGQSTQGTIPAKGAGPLFSPGPAERISYREAFLKYVGVDPHTTTAPQLAATVRSLGIEAPESMPLDDRDGWLDLLLVERIQPRLGIDRPTLLYDYPASQAALARIRQDDPPVAERFELYVSGIELANGYHELLDPQELRARNSEINRLRRDEGKRMLPEESRLLDAMDAGLPSSVGVALGFDRLVMLAAGVQSIAEVMAFPFDRA